MPQCFMVFSTKEWARWKQWSKKEARRDVKLSLRLSPMTFK